MKKKKRIQKKKIRTSTRPTLSKMRKSKVKKNTKTQKDLGIRKAKKTTRIRKSLSVDPSRVKLVNERKREVTSNLINHIRSLFSTLFLTIGTLFLLLFISQLISRYNPARISFKDYTTPLEHACVETRFLPRSIRIPQINVALPVIPSKIVERTWETTSEGVSYLSSSPLPGERGNSILYGHNWDSLLGPLHLVKPGQSIEITYTNGMKRNFVIQTMANVNPDQTEILNPTTDKRITLYTCTGFLDSQRLVVVATLESETIAQAK